METGQKVFVKPQSALAREWALPAGAEGVVLCAYRLIKAGNSNIERVDVRFGEHTVVWGAPSIAYDEAAQAPAP